MCYVWEDFCRTQKCAEVAYFPSSWNKKGDFIHERSEKMMNIWRVTFLYLAQGFRTSREWTDNVAICLKCMADLCFPISCFPHLLATTSHRHYCKWRENRPIYNTLTYKDGYSLQLSYFFTKDSIAFCNCNVTV